jgi:hypothetical protein
VKTKNFNHLDEGLPQINYVDNLKDALYIYIKERLIGYKISLTSLLQNTNIQENAINCVF